MDGTPCAGGGFCRSAKCEGWTIVGMIGYYLQTQPQVAIPVLITSIIVLLAIIAFAVRTCIVCYGKRKALVHRDSNSSSVSLNDPHEWVDPAQYQTRRQQQADDFAGRVRKINTR